MIRSITKLFNKIRHGVFCGVPRRSRSDTNNGTARDRAARSSGQLMSEARSIDAFRVETGSRNANDKPEDSMLIMIVEHPDGSGELRGVEEDDGVISFTPEKWKYIKSLVLRQI